MLTGRPMPVPRWRGPYEGPGLEQQERELKQHMQQLTMIYESIHTQEKLREPVSSKEEGPIKPGDQVLYYLAALKEPTLKNNIVHICLYQILRPSSSDYCYMQFTQS
ncbi:hypothetical protein chiPu_0001746 [Chiloscyllium punctatum]|uniref:Uncharacterized protein n=1 Tax=Chiloscyllium punctatum TaxID=137246 RepID=A0A401RYX3_CHIPU|nr:hypothetical protein [Chiloscyllium punctatum]